MKKFYSYDEIPVATQEYILAVADADSIYQIPLQDINSFLQGQLEWEKAKLEEWEGGWAE